MIDIAAAFRKQTPHPIVLAAIAFALALTASESLAQRRPDDFAVPTWQRSLTIQVDGEQVVVPQRLVEVGATPFDALPRLSLASARTGSGGGRAGAAYGRYPDLGYAGSGTIFEDIQRMSPGQAAGLIPGRDYTPKEEREPDAASILNYVSELENELTTARRIRRLVAIANDLDEYSLKQLRRQYAVNTVTKAVEELRRLLTSDQPDARQTVTYLERTFRNRTPAEALFFAVEYREAHPDVNSDDPIRRARADVLSDLRARFETQRVRTWEEQCLFEEAQWLLEGFKPERTCEILFGAAASLHELNVAAQCGLPPTEVRPASAARVAQVLRMLELLSPKNRTECERLWQQQTGSPLKGDLKAALETADGNVERLEKAWNDRSDKELPPLVRELFPTDDPRWGTKPASVWRSERSAALPTRVESSGGSAETERPVGPKPYVARPWDPRQDWPPPTTLPRWSPRSFLGDNHHVVKSEVNHVTRRHGRGIDAGGLDPRSTGCAHDVE